MTFKAAATEATHVFKLPKLKPSQVSPKLPEANSMQPAVQFMQPTQWDIASKIKGTPKMSSYTDGQKKAYETLGLAKTANVGLLGAAKGLFNAGRAGWAGQGAARAAGIQGAAGALQGTQNYMKGLMRTNPGTAAGLIGTGAAGATYGAGQLLGE